MTREERFTVGDEPRVEVRLVTGSLVVTRGDRGVVRVEVAGPEGDRLRIQQRGGTILVEPGAGAFGRWQSHEVTVHVPEGTLLYARLASAELAAEATLGGLDVDAASGDVRVADIAGTAEVKTASGHFRARTVGGALQFTTASGSAGVGTADGPARLQSASGELRVGTARGAVTAKSASGAITIGRFEGPVLSCKTMSANIEIGVPPGRTLDVDLRTLSGLIRNDFELGGGGDGSSTGHASVQVRTMSGDVALLRAAARS